MPLAGKTHPTLMGSAFQDGFPELWNGMRPVFETAVRTRAAVDVVEMEMSVERNDFVEEAYFNGNFVPIRGDDGEIEGKPTTSSQESSDWIPRKEQLTVFT